MQSMAVQPSALSKKLLNVDIYFTYIHQCTLGQIARNEVKHIFTMKKMKMIFFLHVYCRGPKKNDIVLLSNPRIKQNYNF